MCGIVGGIDTSGGMLSGSDFIQAIKIQHERGNLHGGAIVMEAKLPGKGEAAE